ncbi:MAG TPA: alkaline phosphatase family protein [Chloroflexota bacterium]|nr:alkaline phosphatase family protein [Chloroflexota bacterium]
MVEIHAMPAGWQAEWVVPQYGGFCFSEIPQALPSLFSEPNEAAQRLLGPLAARYDRVILVFIDGFGRRFFQRYAEQYPFLRRFLTDGIVTPLTSQFPSTTAAHVTAIHTGETPGASGVYEWFVYDPGLDATVSPLTYAFPAGTPGELAGTLDPTTLFPPRTMYQRLGERGIASTLFHHRSIATGPATESLSAGARVMPFATPKEGIRTLAAAAQDPTASSYLYLYHGAIDTAAHYQGIHSDRFEREVARCLMALETILHRGLHGARRILLLLTADHGETEITGRIALDREVRQLPRWLKGTSRGLPRISGNVRDAVLHVREEDLDEAESELRRALDGRASVFRIDDLIGAGLFGPSVSDRFRARIGNLMVIPHGRDQIWLESLGFKDFKGLHGGPTADEMETQLAALAYG